MNFSEKLILKKSADNKKKKKNMQNYPAWNDLDARSLMYPFSTENNADHWELTS